MLFPLCWTKDKGWQEITDDDLVDTGLDKVVDRDRSSLFGMLEMDEYSQGRLVLFDENLKWDAEHNGYIGVLPMAIEIMKTMDLYFKTKFGMETTLSKYSTGTGMVAARVGEILSAAGENGKIDSAGAKKILEYVFTVATAYVGVSDDDIATRFSRCVNKARGALVGSGSIGEQRWKRGHDLVSIVSEVFETELKGGTCVHRGTTGRTRQWRQFAEIRVSMSLHLKLGKIQAGVPVREQILTAESLRFLLFRVREEISK